MSNYVVGCDNINGSENTYKEKIATVLRNKGHNVEVLPTGPNHVQSYGLKSGANGKIAVFIVGGSDIGTYVDMIQSYYHYSYILVCFC